MNLIVRAEELLKEATPGPWHYNGNEVVAKANPRCGIAGAMSEEDCELIAESPIIIRGLLDLVKQQQDALYAIDAVFDFSEIWEPNEPCYIEDPSAVNEAFCKAYRLTNPIQAAINEAKNGGETP
jgi:hypothetical protein